jgi:hypothetical protein
LLAVGQPAWQILDPVEYARMRAEAAEPAVGVYDARLNENKPM